MKRQLSITIIAILATISYSVQAQNGNKRFDLNDLMRKGTFRSSGIYEIRSMNDGASYSTLSDDNTYITLFSYDTGDSIREIVDIKDSGIEELKYIVDYQFSEDETSVLIQSDYEPIYRRSFKADYYIYDIKGKSYKKLSENGKQQLATFSPDGEKVAFVRDNNLFIKDLLRNEEIQVTTDGKQNEIINGAPDWVYEEEFQFNKAFAWSPDSRNLAYMRFDERGVKMFNMTMFMGDKPSLRENELYPSNVQFKYPKAGEDNSIVTVSIYNMETEQAQMVDLGPETDQYIPRIMFGQDPEMLVVLRLNRLQNKLEILGTNINNGQSKVIYSEENKYFIDEGNFDRIHFIPQTSSFVITSEISGWTHLYIHDYVTGKSSQITSGEFDVTDYYGYDSKRKLHYFQAAAISPMQREVYSIKNDGKGMKLLSEGIGTNNATFSKSYKYFINSFSNAHIPPIYSINESSGKVVRVLEDNNGLNEILKEYKFNFKTFITIPNEDSDLLNASIIYPPNFDSTKKYPVIFNQYSGPNSQEVLDQWAFGIDDYMAQEGYVIISIDPRGTGARGEAFRKVTYMQLGKYETIDQIAGAKYIGTFSWVDKDRIGIWGWSYGGFISSSCMLKGDGAFKAGVAVAPVTNWRYYDNIYTERYMRTPQENPEGYDNNSPLFFADGLKGRLMLIHGTADDNVHVQNTMELSEKLVQAGKEFDQMIYTNRNHSIYGGYTRIHLFTKIMNFFKENL